MHLTIAFVFHCHLVCRRYPTHEFIHRSVLHESDHYYLVRDCMCHCICYHRPQTRNPTSQRDLLRHWHASYARCILLRRYLVPLELVHTEFWLLSTVDHSARFPYRCLCANGQFSGQKGSGKLDERLDHFLLGMVDRLESFRRNVHC